MYFKSRKLADMNWPYNLLDKINIEGNETPFFRGTKDQLDGLDYAMSTLFEEEWLVLSKRYRDGKSLAETGRIYGVGKDKIRRIEAKAIKKMKHPSRLRYITNGLYGEEKRLAEENRLKAQQLAEKRIPKNIEYLNPALSVHIKDLNLSARSYNGLKRAGINTVGDITQLDLVSLKRIRNLGELSQNEIINKIHNLGLQGKFDKHIDEAV